MADLPARRRPRGEQGIAQAALAVVVAGLLVVSGTAVLLLSGVLSSPPSSQAASDLPAVVPTSSPSPSVPPSPSPSPSPPPAPSPSASPSAPVQAPPPRQQKQGQLRLSVPALGIDTDTLALGTDKNNALEVPKTAQGVGWYRDGYLPGDVGPAVFAGHINLSGRDGTFSKLSTMRPGQEVFTVRPDGTQVRFVVTKVEQHPKNAFPTDAVYGPTAAPELRLITCGGSFDQARRSYRDNTVVFARLA